VLTHLAAHVLLADGERLRPAAGSRRGGADGGVEGDVAVTAPGDPGPRVLAATERNERAVAAPDRAALEAIGWRRRVEDTGRIDVQLDDAGPRLELL
jgi:hypothetical protein